MNSLTFAEKMFARAAGLSEVHAGDGVSPQGALTIIHDGYLGAAYKELKDLGFRRIAHPEKLIGVTDHDVIPTTPQAMIRSKLNRKIMIEWGGGLHFQAGQGGHGHIFPMEMGLVRPGMFLFAYDMHASNFGAIGAYALTVASDITTVLATGSRYSIVPRTILVRLTGELARGVQGRDVGFRLAGDFTSGKLGVSAEAAVVEFQGQGAERLDVSARVGVINALSEISAAHILFPPMTYAGAPVAELGHLQSGPDAVFLHTVDVDLGKMEPTIALPGSPDNAADISSVAGTPIHHAFIGSCGSSQLQDLRSAAEILRGRRVAPTVRLFIVPGSVQIEKQAMTDGLVQIFLDAGAQLLPSGCGPCAGGAIAPVGPGEVSISTAATNTIGRMGAQDADYYLASPLTVAASAVAGVIADPRALHL